MIHRRIVVPAEPSPNKLLFNGGSKTKYNTKSKCHTFIHTKVLALLLVFAWSKHKTRSYIKTNSTTTHTRRFVGFYRPQMRQHSIAASCNTIILSHHRNTHILHAMFVLFLCPYKDVRRDSSSSTVASSTK